MPTTPSQLRRRMQLVTQSTGQVTYKLRADSFLDPAFPASRAALSAKTPATVSISIDPAQLTQPGQYSSTVTILSGAAPPQFLRVTAGGACVDQSSVVAGITPNPVVQDGAEWSFQNPPGRYRAGAGNPGYRVEVQRCWITPPIIIKWFGTDRIAASGANRSHAARRGRVSAWRSVL